MQTKPEGILVVFSIGLNGEQLFSCWWVVASRRTTVHLPRPMLSVEKVFTQIIRTLFQTLPSVLLLSSSLGPYLLLLLLLLIFFTHTHTSEFNVRCKKQQEEKLSSSRSWSS